MRNSILTKFFIGYFSFAVLGFVLITYWSTNLIYNQLLTDKIDVLNSYSEIISDNIENLKITSLNDITAPDDYFSDFNKVLDCNILVLDTNNTMIFTTDDTKSLNENSSNIVLKDFNPNDYKNSSYKINKFYNMYKTDTLSVVHTLRVNGKTIGYVVAHVPTSYIKNSSYDITKTFYITYFIILALSLIIFFNFMWFIYLPLKQIRLAAMEYAQGNFEYEGLKVNNDRRRCKFS